MPESDPPATEPDARSRVQINYKSGLSMIVECDDFTVKRVGSRLTSLEWVAAEPIPMYMGISDVESVWEL